MKHIAKNSLIVKTISILFLMIFPLNILSIVSSRILFQRSLELLRNSVSSTLSSQMNLLDHKINNADYLLYHTLNQNLNYIHLLQQSKNSWKYTFYRYQLFNEIHTSVATSSAADYMFICLTDRDDFLLIAKSNFETADSPATETFQNLLGSDLLSNGQWHLTGTPAQQMLVRIFRTSDGFIGSAILLEEFLSNVERTSPYENFELAFTVTAPEPSSDSLLETVPSDSTDLYLSLSIPAAELRTPFSNELIGLICLIFLAIIPVLYLLFKREVAYPLQKLNHAHAELKTGNEDYRITASASSAEFSYAYDSFNDMAYTLKKLRIDNLNKALAYNQLQLDNLRLQIRPHFLLNTMNLLYALTQTSQLAQASELILYLSEYFRYMFRSDKDLELFEKELNLIQKYLYVSQISFPEEFTISYQIDPILSLLRVPPLLFHNFIENIIQHTLTKGQTVHIVFFGEYEDGTATFQISDDGPGMDPDQAKRINSQDFSNLPKGTHVGIRNAINRLHYYYGDNAALYIDSEPGKGTTITITITMSCDLEEDS